MYCSIDDDLRGERIHSMRYSPRFSLAAAATESPFNGLARYMPSEDPTCLASGATDRPTGLANRLAGAEV